MAVMLRTVSTFGRLACGLARSSGAAARVICGIDSTRLPRSNVSFFKDQAESSFSKSKSTTPGFSQSADPPARCQAATAVCPLPTRQAVRILEWPIEVEPRPAPEMHPATINQSAVPLPRSFLAESVNGSLVECSGRGSRPLYTNVLAEFQLSYTGTSLTEVLPKPDNSAAVYNFHAALENTPTDARLVSEFAMFTWKSLGDVDAAEELFNKALELAPYDPAIQASHALFLWQCDG
ncbi:hypothetical protein M758_UG174100 [Ceratodon purpureus]|nr:hypothetical protein M758_UG174100 [Ceratodon purpureus]KAG0595528.1 hypothetical protein M758_UG174100 [Ceratodon purpureus]KAG0595529.1 hypothetical protein M758_UG174100 [Ceratodon purpureus]